MMRIAPEPKKEAPVVPKKDDPKVIASELLKGLEEQLKTVIEFANQGKPEVTAAKVPDPVVEEVKPAPITEVTPPQPNIEVKVFKHKDVNTLIKSRILALESSVVTKSIDKTPLQELDKTINGVKLTEDINDFNPIIDTFPVKIDDEPTKLPTSNIKNLIASSKEAPKFDNFLSSPSSSDEEENISEPSILKMSREEKPKPQLEKQYSFSMDSKFHEEFGRDGWKTVNDLSTEESSSEEETELESSSSSSSEEDAPIAPQITTKRRIISYSSDSEENPVRKTILKDVKPHMKSVETQTVDLTRTNELKEDPESSSESDEIKYLSSKTVEKILQYGEPSDEYVQHYSSYVENKKWNNENEYYTDDDRSVFDDGRSYYNEYYDNEDDREYRQMDPYEAREPEMPRYRDEANYYDDYADDERTLVDEDEYYRGGYGGYSEEDQYRQEAGEYREDNYELDRHPRYYDQDLYYGENDYPKQPNNYYPDMIEGDRYYK